MPSVPIRSRLIKELALAGITEMKQANAYIRDVYMPAYNDEFAVTPEESASMFVPWAGTPLQDILCEQYERTVGNDNCVKFDGMTLQIPSDKYRFHYVKVKVSCPSLSKWEHGNIPRSQKTGYL